MSQSPFKVVLPAVDADASGGPFRELKLPLLINISPEGGRSRVNSPADAVIGLFPGFFRGATGSGREVRAGGAAFIDSVQLVSADVAGDGYSLSLDPQGLRLAHGSDSGLLYGLITLVQLIRSAGALGRSFSAAVRGSDSDSAVLPVRLAEFSIDDVPAFEHRGFMLDVSRHFFPVDEIKNLLDLCMLLKLNVFHWHLTDDQGWRIDVKAYPRLREISSTRRHTRGDSRPHDGCYSHEDIRGIVEYAAARGITVIPEIDMPGHISAVLAAYPELSCRREAMEVPGRFGIFEDVGCAGNEETYRFFETVLDEVLPLFPGPLLHIGGDEVPKTRWEACPRCQEKIKTESLADEEELQAHFMNRMIERAARHGKRVIVWNEALASGKLHDDAIVQFWREEGGAPVSRSAARRGRATIISHFWHYYLDFPHGLTPLEKTRDFRPGFPGKDEADETTDNENRSIIGIEAPLWTEWVPDAGQLYRQIIPRLYAVAETAWRGRPEGSFGEFLSRAEAFDGLARDLGYRGSGIREASPRWLKARFQEIRFFGRMMDLSLIRTFIHLQRNKRKENRP